MLVSLSIRSFLLIDALDLEAGQGFTALTGETGAGKSIVLRALNLALGGEPDRNLIRQGCKQATLLACFSVSQTHPIWGYLEDHGLAPNRQEPLLLKRVVKTQGPSRAFIGDLPVSAGLLARAGNLLVEIHGQHAATDLLRPKAHQTLLDGFGNLAPLTTKCAAAWRAFQTASQALVAAEAELSAQKTAHAWCQDSVDMLHTLAPHPGEFEALLSQRAQLSQSAKLSQMVGAAQDQLDQGILRDALCQAERGLQTLSAQACVQDGTGDLGDGIEAARQAVERCLIELTEAQALVQDLVHKVDGDPRRLERVEERLSALRGAARKLECLPEALPETLQTLQNQLVALERSDAQLMVLRAAECEAQDLWAKCAERLSSARQKAARQLSKRVARELALLHLERVRFQVQFTPIEPEMSGAAGREQVTFEVETNPGMGFGPLQAIASGGELARFSLALKCALHHNQAASTTLIFDEVDHGVGGAVATAIGARLAQASEYHQVLAITHSPQVAACADEQWQVCKNATSRGQNSTQIRTLNKTQRLEEIARMLSGSSITDEARAAASKLLEVA